MTRAGNPVKSIQWLTATGEYGQKRLTDNMLIEFEDTIAPDQILIGTVPYIVRPYIKEPTQCFNCQHFGHVTKHCHSGRPRCVFCGERGHRKNDGRCRATRPRCCNCGGRHQAYSKICPEYKKEKRALIIKAKTNTTIFNARELANKRYPPQAPREKRDTATESHRQRSNSTISESARRQREPYHQSDRENRNNHHRRQGFSYANATATSQQNETRRHPERPETHPSAIQETSTTGSNQNQQNQDSDNLRLPPGLSDRPKPQRLPRNNPQNPNTNTGETHTEQAMEVTEESDEATALELQIESLQEIMIQTLKVLVPKFIQVLYTTVFMNLPNVPKLNHDFFKHDVEHIIHDYFNLEKITIEKTRSPERADRAPPEPRPSTSKPQVAKKVGGQRHTSKKKKKSSQLSA